MKKNCFYILGGSGLIGKYVCKEAVKKKYKVINLDIKKNNINGVKNIYFDCKDLVDINTKLIDIFRGYGKPLVFVNCSYPTTNDWAENKFSIIKLESLRKNLDYQLTSAVWISRIFGNFMKDKRIKGSIIHFGSIYSLQAQDLNIYKNTEMSENLTYSVIKGGINNLNKQMASYYGAYGIRVNQICIGGVKGHVKNRSTTQSKVFQKKYINKTPLGRMCEPKEVAPSVIFLASKESSYITGATLVIDGGYSIV